MYVVFFTELLSCELYHTFHTFLFAVIEQCLSLVEETRSPQEYSITKCEKSSIMEWRPRRYLT